MRGETVIPFKEEIRERDWSNKIKRKVHADKTRGDVSMSINVGNEFEVLLRDAKSDKLSKNLRLSLFKVVRKKGSEVTGKN